jgi:hypothetical protein
MGYKFFAFHGILFGMLVHHLVGVQNQFPSHYEASAFPRTEAISKEIIEYIENHLVQAGTLKKTPEGFVYVDVDDDYIRQLISFIQNDGFEEPPYFDGPEGVGAHISVLSKEEGKDLEIEELGQSIQFKVLGCQRVHPPQFKGVQEVYFITVEAPDLDLLRNRYELPKGLYEFHITIGVKRINAI